MASSYVRNLAKGWLAAPAEPPFHDTINRVAKPTTDIWLTVEFFAGTKQGTIGCPGYIEYGTIDLIVMAKPGLGDVDAIKALEDAVTAFMAQKDIKNSLTLLESEPLRELSAGDADSYYRVAVGVSYTYVI